MVARKKKVARKTKTRAKKSTKTRAKVKKTTTKRKTTKKTRKATTSSVGRVSKVYTKSMLLSTLAEQTGVNKKDVSAVIETLSDIIGAHVKPGGPGKFTLPGLLKMTVKKVPARKARKGINPFTGEMTTFKAKPASRKVRILALKGLKEVATTK